MIPLKAESLDLASLSILAADQISKEYCCIESIIESIIESVRDCLVISCKDAKASLMHCLNAYRTALFQGVKAVCETGSSTQQ